MGIQIKKFQAPTLQKAIEQVRADMGDNAIILQTEPIKDTGAFGLLGRSGVEVTAAIDRKELAPRFHATTLNAVVGDDGNERSVAGSNSGKAVKKSGWIQGLFQTSKKQSKPIPSSVDSAKKKQVTQRLQPKLDSTALATSLSDSYRSKADLGASSSPSSSVSQLYAVKTFIEPLQKEVAELRAQLKTGPVGASSRKRLRDPLEMEVHQLRNELSNFISEKRFGDSGLPTYYRQLLNFWTDKGMSQKEIFQFFKAVADWGWSFDSKTPEREVASAITTALEGNISEANVFEKRQPRIVILIGPTGVGKTTTIAKMAAHEKLRLKKSVAIVTTDDYKIGGIDQIAHYARILDVPFYKSRADSTLEDQCKLLEVDTLFIDTFGVSAYDSERIANLKKLLTFSDPKMVERVEIHLVLPVAISASDIPSSLRGFADLNAKYLLFTKWDETENWGGMLTALLTSKKPVSFICHGQDVPDAMDVFSKKNFIETVTGFFANQE